MCDQEKGMNREQARAEKARAMRYKKPIVRDLNLEVMQQNLYDMQEACSDVRYAFDGDDGDEIVSAMLGDEEEAQEFKMMFSDLDAEVERFLYDLEDWEWKEYIEGYYDLFMVNGHVADSFGGLLGWDSYEGDYFGLQGHYAEEDAMDQARKKLMKELTKEKMLIVFQKCMKIFTQYVGLQYRYDCLKASMDILREQNASHLKAVKRINEIYEKADEVSCGFQFLWKEEVTELDRLIKSMPQEAFM